VTTITQQTDERLALRHRVPVCGTPASGLSGDDDAHRHVSGPARSVSQIQRDVDDHVFLPADEPTAAALHEDAADIDVIASGGGLGMTEE